MFVSGSQSIIILAACQSTHLHAFEREECVYSGEYLRRNCEWRPVQTMSNADLIVSGSTHLEEDNVLLRCMLLPCFAMDGRHNR